MGLRASIVPPAPGRVGFKVDHFELGGGSSTERAQQWGGVLYWGVPMVSIWVSPYRTE